jgi:hypothetical protein
MADINTIKSTPSLKCATNGQLSFEFISKKSKKNDLSNISQERLIKVIKKLVRIVKFNYFHSENIIYNIELIKNAKNLYEIHSSLKNIDEDSDYIFRDTSELSKDFLEDKVFLEKEETFDECIQTLIKLSKLGVFND